jgi:hypothetical protein
MKFTAHVGECVGQSDDSITIITDGCMVGHNEVSAIDDAMTKAMGWASEMSWPESEGEYSAVVWINDESGETVESCDVTVSADGDLVQP